MAATSSTHLSSTSSASSNCSSVMTSGAKTGGCPQHRREDQHPALGGELQYLSDLALGGLPGIPILDELHGDHRPEPTYLPDQVHPPG